MTSYNGGKKRIGKKIYTEILKYDNKDCPMDYFEPFCGMCGVMVHFAKDNNRNISACDINKDLILMWQALQEGWIPPEDCTREEYDKLKNSKESSPIRGFLGIVCSFSAMFFRGGFRTKSKKYDFVKGGKKGVTDAINILKSVNFMNSASYDTHNPIGKLIYCDPPYKDNKIANDNFDNFDHDKFWNIMREWSKNNIVIISEKVAPEDFVCIWELEYKVSFLNRTGDNNKKKLYTEKLFIHESKVSEDL